MKEMLMPLLSFLSSFALCFVGIPYIRLYVNSDLCKQYDLKKDYAEGGAAAFAALGAFILMFGIVVIAFGISTATSLIFEVGLFLMGLALGAALHPFYLLHIVRTRQKMMEKAEVLRKFDERVVSTAIKYGGVISPLHLIKELKITVEEAINMLERFAQHGMAHKIMISPTGAYIYDFPIARAHLAMADRRIIETLINHPEGLSKSELLTKTNLSLESLEESLSRLISKGIIINLSTSDLYKLRGIE